MGSYSGGARPGKLYTTGVLVSQRSVHGYVHTGPHSRRLVIVRKARLARLSRFRTCLGRRGSAVQIRAPRPIKSIHDFRDLQPYPITRFDLASA